MKKTTLFLSAILLVAGLVVSPKAWSTTGNGVATLTLSPGTSTVVAGSGVIDVRVNTAAASAIGFQIVADFTGTVPDDITFNPAPPSGFAASYNQFVTISGGKRLQTIIDTSSATGYSTNNQSVSLGTITFTAPENGTMTVTFNQAQTAVLDDAFTDILSPVTNATYTFSGGVNASPSLAPSATPAISPSPGSNPTTMKVRFEGVNEGRGNQTISVIFKQGTSAVFDQDLVFEPDAVNDGVYNYLFSAGTFTAGTYDVFIKGPIHLTRKVTGYNYAANTTEINFSSMPLLVGDVLNNDEIDIFDYNQLVTDFGSRYPGSSPGDLDLDDDIDIYDYSYLVSNFGKQGDQ